MKRQSEERLKQAQLKEQQRQQEIALKKKREQEALASDKADLQNYNFAMTDLRIGEGKEVERGKKSPFLINSWYLTTVLVGETALGMKPILNQQHMCSP